jgi:hypothetical protein
MKRLITTVCGALVALGILASPAAAEPEYDKYDIESTSAELTSTQAGAHADFTTTIKLTEESGVAYAKTRDIVVAPPAGLFGNPEAFPKCTTLQFATSVDENTCPQDSQVGVIDLRVSGTISGTFPHQPIFNMPSLGGDMAARFGFFAGGYPVFINVRFDPATDALVASIEGAPAGAELIESKTTFWGVPGAEEHDPERLSAKEALKGPAPPEGHPSNLRDVPFMTNPTSCGVQRLVTTTVTSYQRPEAHHSDSTPFPNITGCGALEFNPTTTVRPTTAQGTTGSGLDYELSLPDKGLQFSNLEYGSELKRAEVTLPEGMTVNPSEAEGLGVCSEADLARETYDSGPNVGCPESSKIGSLTATTPVLDHQPTGSLYLAKPYQNPFGSLLALYMVFKVPDRGVVVRMAGKVSTDPRTGQITTVFDDVPEVPVSEFHLHFREGARAPLITPPACGSYSTLSNLSPYSAPGKALPRASAFAITSGPDHGPCPTGGLPPFHPTLLAGPLSNTAGAFAPFYVKIARTDAEQEITHFSLKLPPGLLAKLAGVPFCPEAAIAAAKARTGIHGGEEELTRPSCPAASQIGTTSAGSGVGDVLVYVPGKLYLAGPYHGSAISVVSITAAKAGPFDLGTVVVREALQVNPETGEVFIDATGSDPIPHIIAGIPVHLRDIRAYVDRPEFTLNPTDCTRTSTASTVLGAGLDFASEADDRPITVSAPFQAADCAALPFAPKLSLSLSKGARRAHPALTARLRMHGIGEAGIARTQVTLPRSEYIENAHFNTICTRVQFKVGKVPGEACPAGSIYGKASATTPLLDEPLTGPVFLRSSEHKLPDLVIALHSGRIDVVLDGRVDSVGGGLRTTFEAVPDAPVSSFTLQMQGGHKGLFVNSIDLCAGPHRAEADFTGQNAKEQDSRPKLRVPCKGKANKHEHRKRVR